MVIPHSLVSYGSRDNAKVIQRGIIIPVILLLPLELVPFSGCSLPRLLYLTQIFASNSFTKYSSANNMYFSFGKLSM